MKNLDHERGAASDQSSVTEQSLRRPNLNGLERRVLRCLTNAYCADDFSYLNFRAITQRTSKLNRQQIRRACRSLARKGLATYGRGLWTEDGEPYGSGYSATEAGLELIEASKR